MRILYLSGKFLKKHLIANILIVVGIVLSLLLITLLLNRYHYFFQAYHDYIDTPADNALFFMGRESVLVEEDNHMESIIVSSHDELIKELENHNIVEGISVYGYFSENNGENAVFVYDNITANYLPLKENINGHWLFNHGKDVDFPVVVYNGGNIEVGDKLSLNLELHNQFSTSQRSSDEIEERKIEAEVIGLINAPPSGIMNSNIKSNDSLSFEDLLQESAFFLEQTVFFMEYHDELFSDYRFSTDNYFVYLKEGAPADEVERLKEKLSEYGYVLEGHEMLDTSKNTAQNFLLMDFSLFFSVAGITLVSLISLTFLNVKKLVRLISIYYINGGSLRRALGAYLVYLFGVIVLSFLIYSGILWLLNYQIHATTSILTDYEMILYQFKWDIQIQAISLISIILIVGSFLPFAIISKKSKLSILKES